MLYESSRLSTYQPAQTKVLFDNNLRVYLDSVTTFGPDYKTHDYRIWDKNIVLTNESAMWKNVMARPHPTMPWIVISNGTTGYEGPLPLNTADTIALIKHYVTPK